ncbi:MAG: hypothetical protein ACRDH9_05185 [Actinomycetota bacterium]
MRPHRTLLAAATAVLTMLPLPAFGHSEPCVDGPARLASAATPHVQDAHGDGTQPWATVLGAGGDIINVWVTGPSAWEDRLSTDKFKATIRFESLERHPFLGRTYFVFAGPGGATQWVRGESDGTDLGWLFSYGHLEGSTYTRDGATNGVVDTAAGTIRIEIPSVILPPRPADGKALNLEIVEVESFLRLPVNPGVVIGNLQSADLASPSCTAVLYEAAPPA